MDNESSSGASAASKACDTLPAPQNLTYRRGQFEQRLPTPEPELTPSHVFDTSFRDNTQSNALPIGRADPTVVKATVSAVPARKLCVRHQRMADQGVNLKLQKSLDALPLSERESVNTLWSMFSSSTHSNRAIILQGILTMCCSSQLSLLNEQVPQLLRIDPFFVLPREISLRVLKFVDAMSLARAAQVSRAWQSLADDDILWRNMCEQHIEKKCAKCGWGLPLLEKKRRRRPGLPPSLSSELSVTQGKKRQAPSDGPPDSAHTDSLTTSDGESTSKRRRIHDPHGPALARFPSFSQGTINSPSSSPAYQSFSDSDPDSPLMRHMDLDNAVTRPWKDVYLERLTVARNWLRGRYSVKTIKGHTDGVMCLQFNENLSHPNFPVLITGSYDRTVRVWNLETGQEVHCLRGHTRAVRALQFDEAKLITGSMDHTLKVWNWRTGKCIRTLEGHTQGVVCLTFDANILASGSVDTTIKIWNFRTGECFTLRGHRDWVNSVAIWDGRSVAPSHHVDSPNQSSLPDMDVGKMLFSASDDGSIRLWDLATRVCVKQFTGHVGQVQSIRIIFAEGDGSSEESDESPDNTNGGNRGSIRAGLLNWEHEGGLGVDGPVPTLSASSASSSERSTPVPEPFKLKKRGPQALLISGSLDNTLKLWDIESGEALQTYFGHIEGVWGVASDKLRLVSASHDRTIKIWVREEGRCMATLVGHRGAVTCLALSDDKIVSGSDDGDVRIWSFAPEQHVTTPQHS